MNNKNTKLYLGIGALVLLLVGIFYYFYQPNSDKLNWSENYKQGNKDPYGLHIARQLVAATQPKNAFFQVKETLAKTLPLTTKNPTNYVFIGTSPYFDTADVKRLLAFVANGNTAFLATKNLPKSLRDSLVKAYTEPPAPEEYVTEDGGEPSDATNNESINVDSLAADQAVRDSETDSDEPQTPELPFYNSELFFKYRNDTAATFNYNHPKLHRKQAFKYTFIQNRRADDYNWYGFDTSVFPHQKNKDDLLTLGTINDSTTCFIRLRYGNGYFLLHTSPLVFTNYYLMQRDGIDYLQNALQYLPEGDTYWDEPSKTYRNLDDDDKESHPEVGMGYEGPFDYLLSQPALRWAFYLLWILAGLYLLFRSKRQQRAIPVLAENTNTSIEFVQNVARLYFLKQDHKKIAQQKMKVFMHTLREKYKLPTHLPKDELIPLIAQKTGVFEEVVRPIFSQSEFIVYSTTVSENDLIEFHNSIDQFNQAAKAAK